MRCRRSTILFLLLALIIVLPTNTYCEAGEDKQGRQSRRYTPSGEVVIFNENFSSNPTGLNKSLWNITTLHDPQVTWVDGNILSVRGEPFAHLALTSKMTFEENTTARLSMSYSAGGCYVGIGWSDAGIYPGSNWKTNLRYSTNGVFIDFWDGRQYLVTYSNGTRTATEIHQFVPNTMNELVLRWSQSVVILEMDGIPVATVSTNIPRTDLHFTITISGHDEFSEYDQLELDYVILSQPSYPSDLKPSIDLLWPENCTSVPSHECIDLQVTGSNGTVSYSWDTSVMQDLKYPWDVPLEGLQGQHILKVATFMENGSRIQSEFMFRIYETPIEFNVTMNDIEPLIDGEISTEESATMSRFEVIARGEDRNPHNFTMHLGITGQGLYIGIQSDMRDGWNSRIALHITDWTRESGLTMTVPAPSGNPDFNQIVLCTGVLANRTDYPGLVGETDLVDGRVSVEFLIPEASSIANNIEDIGIAVCMIEGGYSYGYPYRPNFNRTVRLFSVHGESPVIPNVSPIPVLILLMGLIILVALYRLPSKEKNKQHLDEELDRLRTLVRSYPSITPERLSKLMSTSQDRIKENLKRLKELNLIDQSITQDFENTD